MRIVKFAALCLASSLLSGCSDTKAAEYSSSFFAMDTYMTFTAYGDNAEQAVNDVKAEISRLERQWSVTDEGSDIYAINHSDGKSVVVNAETAELINFSLEIAQRTDGALDPTIYPLVEAWGFTTEKNKVPTAEELSVLLNNVGYEQVLIDNSTVKLTDGMMLDLGAVGKGYAGDISAELLRKSGVTSALLDIGGNIQAIGSRPDGSNWRLGLRDPVSSGILGIISISDLAVVTSGSYERFFISEDGKKYCHIIDPNNGYPVDNGLLSVTVIADEGRKCDALSTALFVMGAEKAAQHWQQHQDFEMIMISDNGEIHLTKGAAEMFTLSDDFNDMPLIIIQ